MRVGFQVAPAQKSALPQSLVDADQLEGARAVTMIAHHQHGRVLVDRIQEAPQDTVIELVSLRNDVPQRMGLRIVGILPVKVAPEKMPDGIQGREVNEEQIPLTLAHQPERKLCVTQRQVGESMDVSRAWQSGYDPGGPAPQ